MRVLVAALLLLGLVALVGVSAKKSHSQATALKCKTRFRAERLAALQKTYESVTGTKKKHKHHSNKHHHKKGETCEVELVLLDGYGDGWNGAKLDVLVDGEVKMDGITLENGERAEAKLKVPDKSFITFKYTAGEYPEENEFRLRMGGRVIYQNGHGGGVPSEGSSVQNAIICKGPSTQDSGCGNESLEDCPFRTRKEWRDMSKDEQELFLDAVNELKKSGTYDQFVAKHKERGNKAWAHGNNGFLPWHRSFLWDFESALRVLGGKYACVTLPYWDWSLDSTNFEGSALFSEDTFGLAQNEDRSEKCVITGKFAGWKIAGGKCLQRKTREYNGKIPGPATIMTMVSTDRYAHYNDFRPGIEFNGHGQVHMRVGGDMAGMGSPADPLFFLHHCNIDRVWALWQDCHDYDLTDAADLENGKMYHEGPSRTHSSSNKAPLDRPMQGHTTTPRLMHSIVNMGYRYAADSFFEHNSIKEVCNPTSRKEGSAWSFFHDPNASTETALLSLRSKSHKNKHHRRSRVKGAQPNSLAQEVCDKENEIVEAMGCDDPDALLAACVDQVEKESCQGDSINICQPQNNDACSEFAKEFNLEQDIAAGCCSDILCGSGEIGEGVDDFEYGSNVDDDIMEGEIVEASHPEHVVQEVDGTAESPNQEV